MSDSGTESRDQEQYLNENSGKKVEKESKIKSLTFPGQKPYIVFVRWLHSSGNWFGKSLGVLVAILLLLLVILTACIQENRPGTRDQETTSLGGFTNNDVMQFKNIFIDEDRLVQGNTSRYLIGVGRADITGPAADVSLMGYAKQSQIASGIHTRLFSRAFIIGQGPSRFVFVNLDSCMGSTLVKLEVLKILERRYGKLYTAENLCISAIHTHSAPAGYLQDALFQITSKGYVPETLKAMVNGIVESIRIAHDSVGAGSIFINKGELLDTNINRSPTAYVNNPEKERAEYKHEVDKEMTLIKFVDAKGRGIGMINWFPVHCTSMNNTNTLLSGDNKGYAQLLFEQEMDPNSLAGKSSFVAAFAQSNEGDVSPNTKGAHCLDTGLPCDAIHSTCDGVVKNCVASGPGKDMFQSTKIIGRKQFQKALELYSGATEHLTGPVQYVQEYIDMTNRTVTLNSTHTGRTCKPSMGFSFAAGTTDGPGPFNFQQGNTEGNAFWRLLSYFIHGPSDEQRKCQAPKPILLDTGSIKYPYPWQPDVVDTQLFRVGRLLIIPVPGEFTTMSGRRLRKAVIDVMNENKKDQQFQCVVAGLSNTYSDYIATYEEYQVQRYEGASTIYGPHTLAAYIDHYKRLSALLAQDKKPTSNVTVHNNIEKLLTFVPGVVMDSAPIGRSFGDVLIQPADSYKTGETVSVQFVSGNPRNSLKENFTFLAVERRTDNVTYETVLTDANWNTKYMWKRSSPLGGFTGTSEVTIEWEISRNTCAGQYRVSHFGHYKRFLGRKKYFYSGRTRAFYVFGKKCSK